jgi:glycosyltransferase involved in cell wall biosynthesis
MAAGDDLILARHGLSQRRFLLAVGSMNPTKNLAMLVRAWAALARDDVTLVVVGGGNARVFAASDLPRTANVLMLGSVDDAALVALYRHAAGLVFPSLYEGFGLPPLEAMAGGCPVAASRAASLPEVCADAALMFDPLDPAAMAEAMRSVLDDAALAGTLRERGRRRAAEFTWDRSAAALLQALEAVA